MQYCHEGQSSPARSEGNSRRLTSQPPYVKIGNRNVTYNMPRRTAASDVFLAVADPTRRSILDRLRCGDAHVNELVSGFRVSRPAISRHLRVLRKAQLVRERKEGRQRIYQLEPDRIEQVAQWAEEYRQLWQHSLTNLKRRLEKEAEDDSK